jgi:hypothetical protein
MITRQNRFNHLPLNSKHAGLYVFVQVFEFPWKQEVLSLIYEEAYPRVYT